MNKIVDYKVVAYDSLAYFEKEIRELLAQGYQPWGSLAVAHGVPAYKYQPMVKYEQS